MAEASIPVDLLNPGQVFACLGFMEAADILLGDAEGGFDWSDDAHIRFTLHATGEQNPFEAVLEFLTNAEIDVIAPEGVKGPWPGDACHRREFPAPVRELLKSDKKGYSASALPTVLRRGRHSLYLSHWLEILGLDAFKLFAGKQIAAQLTSNMIAGDAAKPGTQGVAHLYQQIVQEDCRDPFIAAPVGGRFGYDSRGAWDAMSVGWSLDRQAIPTIVSPVVELLAAVGLENARPEMPSTYEIRYCTWGRLIPPILARAVLGGAEAMIPRTDRKVFRGHLGSDQRYKKCFPAQEESDT